MNLMDSFQAQKSFMGDAMAIFLIRSKSLEMLDGFKFGYHFNREGFTRMLDYTQGVDPDGHWLLIEDPTAGDDNATYSLNEDGLSFESTGVEI